MSVKIRFFGAAQNVTGSSYILETGTSRILVDCGYYQERDLRERNWHDFPIPPDQIDAVLLTHAHLDHSGRLPKLTNEGFNGAIHCTSATADIAKIILLDSAHLQEEDTRFKQQRHEREGRQSPHPYQALYTAEDVKHMLPQFNVHAYNDPFDVCEGIKATFRDAGHILGSASIFLEIQDGGKQQTILFSGDVGRWDTPILCDPCVMDAPDVLVVESTYGNRTHGERDDIPEALAKVVNQTRKAGGNIVVPCFAVERSQEMLFHLSELLRDNKIPHLITFMDSPMAIRVTEVFNRHEDLFDEETVARLANGDHPCDFPGLNLSRSTDQSKSINHIRGTCMIIAGSGMCTGGRIKHHLEHNISDEASTVLFVGYQAVGTLGRLIVDGAHAVRIHGNTYPVRANIERITGFSAHADRDELMRWIGELKAAPSRIIVTHGEEKAANAFAQLLREKTDAKVSVPGYQDVMVLN